MKKFLLILFFLIGGATAAYSQMYVGGSVSFSSTSSSFPNTDGYDDTSTFSFGISPRIGWQLGERTSVGVSIGMVLTTEREYYYVSSNELVEIKDKVVAYAFSPFVRYDFVRIGNFALAGDASIGYGWSKINTTPAINNTVYASIIGLSFKPVLTLDISKHITLEAQLNFLSLEYMSAHAWTEGDKENTNTFNFGFDSGNIITPGNLTFGMIYRF